jgi:small subunit ribosomal protein S1
LSFAPIRNIADFFKVGDKLPLKVIEFDKEAKKIVLSAVEFLRSKEQDQVDAYMLEHPVPQATVGEVVGRKARRKDAGTESTLSALESDEAAPEVSSDAVPETPTDANIEPSATETH